MFKLCVQAVRALKDFRHAKEGVVSFEYVIVAACIVGAVAAAFGTDATGAIGTALTGAIAKITAAVTAAA
ncbi:hypothetical protein JQ594_29500 [Bradyrhizobium manausense]|uniref:hypothetical protein n=1 Tax=Bradyrhizobium manausense TaxID=989370 RepID=UPI001BADB5CA|nr:hypothetical protein [Bradyrhizobium manausense]MBR0690077.1 hypothetical protein [Bradyrhizobium manausense]